MKWDKKMKWVQSFMNLAILTITCGVVISAYQIFNGDFATALFPFAGVTMGFLGLALFVLNIPEKD